MFRSYQNSLILDNISEHWESLKTYIWQENICSSSSYFILFSALTAMPILEPYVKICIIFWNMMKAGKIVWFLLRKNGQFLEISISWHYADVSTGIRIKSLRKKSPRIKISPKKSLWMPLSANLLRLESSILTRARRATNRNNVANKNEAKFF